MEQEKPCNTEACIVDTDCQVSAWSWTECSADGMRTGTRIVTVQPTGAGKNCPVLTLDQECGSYDLALTKNLKSGQSRRVKVGDNVTFTIIVTNE